MSLRAAEFALLRIEGSARPFGLNSWLIALIAAWIVSGQSLPAEDQPIAPAADTQAGRPRQMKAFLQKFSAHQLWSWPQGDGSRHELRLLPAAVHRYEDPDRQLIDGALFIIAQGTNPEATLFLEAVNPLDAAQPNWQFGIGRTSFAEQIVS